MATDWVPLKKIVRSLAGCLAAGLAGSGWLAGWLAGGDVGWWMVSGDMEAETESPTRSTLERSADFMIVPLAPLALSK